MEKSLKQQTVTGVFWSAIEQFGFLGIQFITTIIIARILTPADYGLIGLLTIFTALGMTITDSGFGQALIQKKDVTEIDYSTVFYTNLVLGLIIYFILYLCSPLIANFFHTPELEKISKWVFLVFPINSIGIIQYTIITKNVNFKALTKISVISSIISGIFGISLAYNGMGVWALVYQNILYYFLKSILLWYYNHWKPSLNFSFKSFKNLFGFSSNLLGTSMIIILFNNLYTVLIGRFYAINEVGYYNQAYRFENIPASTLTTIIQRVSYPILSTIQNDNERLKSGYRKIINQAVFFNFPLMIGLIVIGHNLFDVLLTAKWLPAVPYFQLLCVYGALFPLQSINVNILKVKGKGGTLLKLEILRRIIMILVILITIKHGIIVLLIGNIFTSVLSISINMYVCGKEINLKILEQIHDIIPYLLASIISSGAMFLIDLLIQPVNLIFALIIQIIIGAIIYLALSEILKLRAYLEIKEIIKMKKNEKK